jgi:hypothetical protein
VTHSYAVLTVSAEAHDAIALLLREAGYDHAFDRGLIDMHGIALERGSTGSGRKIHAILLYEKPLQEPAPIDPDDDEQVRARLLATGVLVDHTDFRTLPRADADGAPER